MHLLQLNGNKTVQVGSGAKSHHRHHRHHRHHQKPKPKHQKQRRHHGGDYSDSEVPVLKGVPELKGFPELKGEL